MAKPNPLRYDRKAFIELDSKFEYHESHSRTILQNEFKFELPNLDKQYDDMLDPFDNAANYHLVCTFKASIITSYVGLSL